MLKKLLMLCLVFMLSVGSAFAAVDVNTADEAALDSVKGLGPVKSKAIVDERTKNGPFKDADDLANRVKGLGVKSVSKLEENGLTIGGSSTPPTGKTASTTMKPAATAKTGASAAPNSTVKSSTAATAATSPAATTAQTPAATPASAPAAASSGKASKKAKASASAASGSMAASDAKPAKSKRSKKDKAASAAAASQ